MCGFAGFVGSRDSALLQKMGEALRHRGPDQDGMFESDGCSFAHKRLSIIDLSEAGRQPLATADGRFTVAYNGEVYNYRELRTRYEAQGWKFQTQTDTECFLASASLNGLKDLCDFHGMFAFALWDRETKTTFVARDRMGIKPLYVSEVGGRFSFASEISGLLPTQSRWSLDTVARSMYLAVGYVGGERTMFQGITSLVPGILFAIRDGKREQVLSFAEAKPQQAPTDRAEAVRQLRKVVDASVAAQTVSDRPVGVFLSGGLDSSVVLSAMRLHQPTGVIKTFTTRFKHHVDDPKFNVDADIARRTAERYGCEHHEIEVGAEDVIAQAEFMAKHLGQPHNNSAIVAVDAAARLTAAEVPVVLTGDGGDELFGGYRRYELWTWASHLLSTGVFRYFSRFVKPEWRDLFNAPDEAARLLTFHALPFSRRKALFTSAADDTAVLALWREELKKIKAQDPVQRFMALDRATWLRDDAFVRSDRLSMRHGLESRVPLVDDAVISFALGLPRKWMVTARASKSLWREAFADRCLPEVIQGSKRGWITPASKWIRVGLTDWMRTLVEEAAVEHEWINAAEVYKALDEHLESRSYRLIDLWTIASYQLWWREYKDYFA